MATQTTRRRWVYPHANDGVGTGFNPRLTRAYGEGREEIQAANPYSSSSTGADFVAYTAWKLGNDNKADASYIMETYA